VTVPVKGENKAAKKESFFRDVKKLFAISVPITLGAVILPAAQLIDSVQVINILKGGGLSVKASTALYGLMTGHVMSLINLPVVLSVAVATAVMPQIAASVAVGNKAAAQRQAGAALKTAFTVAVLCALIMCFFGGAFIKILYGRGLRNDFADEYRIAAQLLSVASFSIVYIAAVQVITAALQAAGKIYIPVINLAVGAAVKAVLNLILVSRPGIGIYGAAVSTCACYAVAAILNYIALRKHLGRCEVSVKEIFLQVFSRKREKVKSEK